MLSASPVLLEDVSFVVAVLSLVVVSLVTAVRFAVELVLDAGTSPVSDKTKGSGASVLQPETMVATATNHARMILAKEHGVKAIGVTRLPQHWVTEPENLTSFARAHGRCRGMRHAWTGEPVAARLAVAVGHGVSPCLSTSPLPRHPVDPHVLLHDGRPLIRNHVRSRFKRV